MNDPAQRPVYILGAGFSKAIDSAMPVTNELGSLLKSRLAEELEINLRDDQTFEDWLTLQVTPLPFLEGFENARRSAEADRVIAEIARVLDERVADATLTSAPLWLRQLISVWHHERAIVLTFNYDTLVERATNASPPASISESGLVQDILGDHVAFPAPPAPYPQFMGDSGAPHSSESFELVKLHGSLAWYWASGDPTGSTLVRVRERHKMGSAQPFAREADFQGTTTLDRYLIPPITSKDGFYGSYLSNTLWRRARGLISQATSMTLIGYSLPPEDRVASELVVQAPEGIPVMVVDRDPGTRNPPRAVVGNLGRLGITNLTSIDGFDCVPRFAMKKVESAVSALAQSEIFAQLEDADADVIIAVTKGWSDSSSKGMYLLVRAGDDRHFAAKAVPYAARRNADVSLRQAVSRSETPNLDPEDFLTASKLRAHIAGGIPFVFEHPHSIEQVVAVGLQRITVDGLELLELRWAPQ